MLTEISKGRNGSDPPLSLLASGGSKGKETSFPSALKRLEISATHPAIAIFFEDKISLALQENSSLGPKLGPPPHLHIYEDENED